jgi:peptidoglycan/LPS O-acetylase OafA/YrhL
MAANTTSHEQLSPTRTIRMHGSIGRDLDFHAARIPALDGIRGTALLLIVIFAHTHPQLIAGGNFGVDTFFVLSGFLITSLLLQEAREFGSINIPQFYARRALRLLPALHVMVAAVVLYDVVFTYPAAVRVMLTDAVWIAAYAFNWTLPQTDGLPHSGMITHLWSLSIEEQFYLVWPLLLTLMIRAGGARLLIAAVLGIIVPEVVRASMWSQQPTMWIYFNTGLRCDGLMMGAAVAFLAHHYPRVSSPTLASALRTSGPVALAGLLILSSFNLVTNGYAYLWGIGAANALAALIIASAVFTPAGALNTILEFPPLRWVGKISYGLYIWHVPVMAVCNRFPDPWTRNTVAIPATFAIAALSFYCLETPFLKMKSRFTPMVAPFPSSSVANSVKAVA